MVQSEGRDALNPTGLDLGCGRNKLVGFLGVDRYFGLGVDVLAMAEYLPFRPNTFIRIRASHTLEHVDNFAATMREAHRVLRPNGTLDAVVPLGMDHNPYHRRHFWRDSLSAILEPKKSLEGDAWWVLLATQVRPSNTARWHIGKRWFGARKELGFLLGKVP